MTKRSLTFLVPVFNEEGGILRLFLEVNEHLPTNYDIDYYFLFVDDGSQDGSWDIIKKLSRQNERVQGVRLSRNFGKESALRAGIEAIETDAVVSIDCDLQHPPELLVQMIGEWVERGIPVVEAYKESRQSESALMRIFAKSFYKAYAMINGTQLEGASDFKLLDKIVVGELKKMPERMLFFRGAVDWLGFQKKSIAFTPPSRFSGDTGWSLAGLAKYAITSLFCFSFRPLYFVLILYLIYGMSALCLIGLTIYSWMTNQSAEGFPTTYLIILLSFALLFFSLMVLTGYITVIFTEIKGRQHYVVSEHTKS